VSQPHLLGEVLKLWETARNFEPSLKINVNQLPSDQALSNGLDALRKGKVVAYGSYRLLRRMGQQDSAIGGLNLFMIGSALHAEGKNQRALHYLDRALSLLRRFLGLTNEHYLGALLQWARTHESIGQDEQTIAPLEEAIVAARDANVANPQMVGLEDMLGRIYVRQNLQPRARRILERVLKERVERHGPSSREAVEAMMALAGAIGLESGETAAVRALVTDACRIVQAHEGMFWADKASLTVYRGAADLASFEGDVEGEINYLREIVRQSEVVSTDRDPTTVWPCLRLAEVLLNYNQCHSAMDVLIELQRRGPDLDWITPADKRRFILLFVGISRQLDVEIPLPGLLRACIDASALDFRQSFSFLNHDARSAAARQLWNDLRAYLAFIWQSRDLMEQDDVLHAYDLVIEFKGVVADSLCISKESRLAGLFPKYRADFERLTQLKRLLQSSFDEVFQGLPESDRERAASRLKFEKMAIESRLKDVIPEAIESPPCTVIDVASALDRIAPGSLLIDFVHTCFHDCESEGLAIFFVPAGRPGLLRMITLEDYPAIRSAVDHWREHVRRGQEVVRELWLMLWEPIAGVIAEIEAECEQKFTRLLVSPDGFLHWLPLQALSEPDGGTALIDLYEISYVGSARELPKICSESLRPGETPLCIGLNEFDPPTGSPLKNLAFAESETVAVAKLLNGELWIGESHVRRPEILARLGHIDGPVPRRGYRSPSVLHVATHGLAEEVRSGLLLAGGLDSLESWRKGDLDDPPGILDTVAISGLDLRETRLTTLSACDTGLGPVTSGEGNFGLPRAFQVAGVQTLIMSLWSVDDIATSLFMKTFYSRLQRGTAISTALQQTQIAMRQRFNGVPFYWAGFVCIGNPLPLVR